MLLKYDKYSYSSLNYLRHYLNTLSGKSLQKKYVDKPLIVQNWKMKKNILFQFYLIK